MISLTVTGHAQPEQSRDEIARLLKEHGVGAVCLLRDGGIASVLRVFRNGRIYLGDNFECYHAPDGTSTRSVSENKNDIIRVWPEGTRLRVTVEVVE
jgi:hypothetical protein